MKKGKYNFNQKQKELLYHDDWSCKLCGSNHKLQLHHITHKRNYAMSIYNALLLCEDCHRKYGSSSAGDTKKHLNLVYRIVTEKVKRLEKNNLTFRSDKFFEDYDYKFLEENKKYYD